MVRTIATLFKIPDIRCFRACSQSKEGSCPTENALICLSCLFSAGEAHGDPQNNSSHMTKIFCKRTIWKLPGQWWVWILCVTKQDDIYSQGDWEAKNMALLLPAEIVLAILSHLDTKDVFNFRRVRVSTFALSLAPSLRIVWQCSKASYKLSKARSIWDSLIWSCIIEADIPLPGLAGRSLGSLCAQELEDLHRRALQLHRNWHSEFPVIKRSFRLSSSNRVAQIMGLSLLPSRDGDRWLVSLEKFNTQVSGKYRIRCWDLRRMDPVCVACRDFDRFGGMAANKSGNEIAALTQR